MGRLRLALLCCLVFAPAAHATAEDLVDFLEARDVVFEGIVTRIDVGPIVSQGGCGDSAGAFGIPVPWNRQFHIRAEETLLGTVEDSVILLRGFGLDQHVEVGARVVAFGNRVCKDGGRLWGGTIQLTPSNGLVPSYDRWLPGPEATGFRELVSALKERYEQSGFHAFEQAAGVALVRLKAYTKIDSRTFSYTCDSLGWAIPTRARVPSRIVFHRPEACAPETGPGVVLVVPIPEHFFSDTLTVVGCPFPWRIEGGVVGGFAVPPNELNRALERTGKGFAMRPRVLPR